MTPPAKLLVVDDNPVVLLGFSELLRSAGFEVLEARTGEDALRLARGHSPELILLDVMCPTSMASSCAGASRLIRIFAPCS